MPISRQLKQNLVVLVLSHEQSLTFICQLYLRAQNVDSGGSAGVVLILCKLK